MAYSDFDALRVAGVPLYPPGVDISGKQYFVAGNYGSDGNTGLSWDDAFKTVAAAITASNANIAASSRGWAARNTIFISGDYFDEDLVAFPVKCDVIGVGSYDANLMPGLYGNHAPVNTSDYGSRWFNVMFTSGATASPLITLTSAASGPAFVGCHFRAHASTTSGILATATPFLKVHKCKFDGAFATSYISLGAGEAGGLEIIGNYMVDAAAAGIIVNSSTTTSWRGVIDRNFIQAATLTIDENADLIYITNNTLISAAAATSYPTCAEVIDYNVKRACNNYLTCDNLSSIMLPAADSTT